MSMNATPRQGECSCYGAAAALGLQWEFWRSALSAFPEMATLHHCANPIYLGVAQRQRTDPASVNVSYIVTLDGVEEITQR